ncbi:uncharacterized protein LOC143859191 isoform X1 [Tasmannia lanceolata]|uniref:uncharacterized protein LOC143859191 isoform X1 n=1 Tax=Tasmannia lanceolata TaxID=3420 RepID=UPI0040649D7D
MSDLRLQYCHVSGNDLTFMVDSLNWLNCRPPPLRDKGLNVRLVDGPGDIGKHVSFLRPKKVGIGRWREAFVAGWIVCFLTGRRIERSLPVSHNKCLRSENEANIAKWQCELMLKMDEASKSIEEVDDILYEVGNPTHMRMFTCCGQSWLSHKHLIVSNTPWFHMLEI